ncbi:MAG: hypothetical protein QM504_17505 [Pseudomonadota bacterium]
MKNKTTYDRAMHDKTHPYTLISAELINNEDLSGEERFLMIYLLGRSDDYIFNSSYFANQAKQLFGWGRDKFYKIWMSLQNKGYISKEKIRVNGVIDGEHYTVHEILPQFLKSQNTENPESGESEIRQTSALPSIDKPNIDIPIIDLPINTKTNRIGDIASPTVKNKTNTNDQVNELFALIVKLNPVKHTCKWKMNNDDKKLLQRAITIFGFEEASTYSRKLISNSKKEYCSLSYIFSDIKDEESAFVYMKKDPDLLFEISEQIFDYFEVETKIYEAGEPEEVFNFIIDKVSDIYSGAKHWKMSEKDAENCDLLLNYGEKVWANEKLQAGLRSAVEKNEWSFNQIVYQAVAAINTYDETYGL